MEIIARLITTLYSEATISCIVNLKFKSYQTKELKIKEREFIMSKLIKQNSTLQIPKNVDNLLKGFNLLRIYIIEVEKPTCQSIEPIETGLKEARGFGTSLITICLCFCYLVLLLIKHQRYG